VYVFQKIADSLNLSDVEHLLKALFFISQMKCYLCGAENVIRCKTKFKTVSSFFIFTQYSDGFPFCYLLFKINKNKMLGTYVFCFN